MSVVDSSACASTLGPVVGGRVRLPWPVGPLLVVFDPPVVREAKDPKVAILLVNRLPVVHLDADDGLLPIDGHRRSVDGELGSLVVEPERLDRLMSDLRLLVRGGSVVSVFGEEPLHCGEVALAPRPFVLGDPTHDLISIHVSSLDRPWDVARAPMRIRPARPHTVVLMGGESRLRVEVLGPLRATDDAGRDVTPEGALQRRLLALLVLYRGRIVSADAAIEALWPGQPPRDPTGALQTHMSRLRRGLPDGTIDSTAEGYYIAPARLDVDADRLSDAVHRAVGTDDSDASGTIDEILGRWHGPAYQELADVDAGRVEAVGLAELRVRAVEARAQQRLAAGVTDGLVGELAALADDEPLRERPRELLMSALAATGRHAEALRVYDDFRRLLAEELGIAPSPVLAAKQADILAGVDAVPWRPTHRLPLAVTSLEGRASTMEQIIDLAGDRRLLTLIGPGGVGKTRLLIEVGHRLQADHPQRPVVMCELAGANADSAVDVVAAALSIDRRAGETLADRLATVLGDSAVVLLLDNCEHVLDPIADLVDRLLRRCPHVSVVATSRERLRIPGEQLYVVPPLSTFDDDGPAVQLFVERARAVVPQFDPDTNDRVIIAEIVRRLDGLPLAIELAAARLPTLDVGEVAAGLDRRFELLSAGPRTSTRHGSLAAAVSWSYDQLDAELQRSFVDLAVFAGSFTVEDAAAICAIEVRRSATVLDQLAERSLVVRVHGRRYTLLETLRAFGNERLQAESRAEPVRHCHARHYVEWIEAAHRLLTSRDAVDDIDVALPELRAAFAWLIDRQEVELAGRLVVALAQYGLLRLRPEVLAWAERVIVIDSEDRSPLAAQVWAVASYAAWMAGDVPEAGVRAERAFRVAGSAGDLPVVVGMVQGNHALFEGRLPDAATWYRKAAAAADDPAEQQLPRATELLALAYAGDRTASDRATALLDEVGDSCTPHAAYVWYCAGEAELAIDVDRARMRFARAAELAELTNGSFVTGVAGTSMASIEARFGDPRVAAEDYRRLIVHWRRAGMWSTQWTMLRSIAGLLSRLDRPHDAAVLTGSVLATRAGHRIFGEDEVALADLGERLRKRLGDEAYETALAQGSELTGEDAVEFALRALS
jgi:predicted ATPase/DNA-binding SARP family transcriptional activator